MARKNQLVFPLLTNQSLAADFISPVTIVKYLDNISYQINVATSDSTGTFALQASNDYSVSEPTNTVINAGTWTTLPIGGTPTVASANDTILIDINQIPFNALRIIYTAGTPGTGTCTAILQARQLAG